MTNQHDKALSELRDRLTKLQKTDRGISWQLYNWQHTEELTVYGSAANCLKWILDNTDEIIAALHTPIEAGNGGDGWLDISSAPKHRNVLVWREDAGEPWVAQYTDETFYDADNGDPDVMAWFDLTGRYEGVETPIHWRPLPPPPSPSSEGEKQL